MQQVSLRCVQTQRQSQPLLGVSRREEAKLGQAGWPRLEIYTVAKVGPWRQVTCETPGARQHSLCGLQGPWPGQECSLSTQHWQCLEGTHSCGCEVDQCHTGPACLTVMQHATRAAAQQCGASSTAVCTLTAGLGACCFAELRHDSQLCCCGGAGSRLELCACGKGLLGCRTEAGPQLFQDVVTRLLRLTDTALHSRWPLAGLHGVLGLAWPGIHKHKSCRHDAVCKGDTVQGVASCLQSIGRGVVCSASAGVAESGATAQAGV